MFYAHLPTTAASNPRNGPRNPVWFRLAAAVALLAPGVVAPVVAQPADAAPMESAAQPVGLFSVDSTRIPTLTLSWTQVDGDRVEIVAALPYGVDADRAELGSNVQAYVAIGGTRLSKGAGHPRGTLVRVGFYKVFAPSPFFANIKPGTNVDVSLSGVAFDRPANPIADTVVMHLKYNPDDLVSCGLPPGAFECFNLASEVDLLNDRVIPGTDARVGVLAKGAESGARSDAVLNEDGTMTLSASVPYAFFRNILDPWASELPGTFLEPIHFHLEVEILPEGVEPIDIEANRERIRQIREQLDELD